MIAGLAAARHDWVVVLACDAPRLDQALVTDLLRLAVEHDSPAMVRQGGFWQPMFSVLPRKVLPLLEQAWSTGERSLQKALLRTSVQGLECTETDSRLSNFNSPSGSNSDQGRCTAHSRLGQYPQAPSPTVRILTTRQPRHHHRPHGYLPHASPDTTNRDLRRPSGGVWRGWRAAPFGAAEVARWRLAQQAGGREAPQGTGAQGTPERSAGAVWGANGFGYFGQDQSNPP